MLSNIAVKFRTSAGLDVILFPDAIQGIVENLAGESKVFLSADTVVVRGTPEEVYASIRAQVDTQRKAFMEEQGGRLVMAAPAGYTPPTQAEREAREAEQVENIALHAEALLRRLAPTLREIIESFRKPPKT